MESSPSSCFEVKHPALQVCATLLSEHNAWGEDRLERWRDQMHHCQPNMGQSFPLTVQIMIETGFVEIVEGFRPPISHECLKAHRIMEKPVEKMFIEGVRSRSSAAARFKAGGSGGSCYRRGFFPGERLAWGTRSVAAFNFP